MTVSETSQPLAALQCLVCFRHLEEVQVLVGCHACGKVRMCEDHIAALIVVEGRLRPHCRPCALAHLEQTVQHAVDVVRALQESR